MPALRLSAFVLAAAMGAGPSAAEEVTLRVDHSWYAPSELAALQVLAERLAAEGIGWKDVTSTRNEYGLPLELSLQGKRPPHVFVEPLKEVYDKLLRLRLGHPLTGLYNRIGVTGRLPAGVIEAITVNGEIMKAPLGIHIDGMIYFNRHVAEATGVDPTRWRSFDDLFADFDRVKKAGYIPIAIGAEGFQIPYLFQALVAATSGGAIYERFYGWEPDRSAIDTPEMRAALALLRRIQQHADPASLGRSWMATVKLVIDGKALLQIHGDWMKGEFFAAGKKLGADFGCAHLPGTRGIVVSVDAFGFLNIGDPAISGAEERLAALVVEPAVAAAFAAKKGATPAVLDPPPGTVDACSQIVLDMLAKPGMEHLNPLSLTRMDWYGASYDMVNLFWANPGMSEDEAVAALEAAYDRTMAERPPGPGVDFRELLGKTTPAPEAKGALE